MAFPQLRGDLACRVDCVIGFGDAMDERIAAILSAVPEATIVAVAASALGTAVAGLDGPADFTEIKRPHAEERTIGIVRASGRAGGREWSSVIKLVDLSVTGSARVAGMTWPENEELVLEGRLFADEGLSFRPVRCYAVTRPAGSLKLFWLEDLTSARGAPFSVEQVLQMARHLGEWNGRHAGAPPALGFAVGRDGFSFGIRGWNFPQWLQTLDRQSGQGSMRAMYGIDGHKIVAEVLAATDRLVERVRLQPHGLAFGDCSVGNMFYRPTETVAIDWASLTDDPVGVDGGRLIGSAYTWGPAFLDAVRAGPELFESYVTGLRSGGWRGEVEDVRRAALAQICAYYLTTSLVPVLIDGKWRGFIEDRYGMPAEELCRSLSGLVATMPALIAEIDALLAK